MYGMRYVCNSYHLLAELYMAVVLHPVLLLLLPPLKLL
jgi:hypothetical protein